MSSHDKCFDDCPGSAPVDGADESQADGVVPADDVPSSSTDTSPVSDATFTLPDGRVCTGHDEDGDGIPDDCDNCPNVANPSQGGGTIGSACAPASAFIPTASRLLFDPFTSLGSWKAYGTGTGAFEKAPDGDSLLAGSLADELRFLQGSTGSGAAALVATTTVAIAEENNGSAGLLLRINGDPMKRFYLCALSNVNGFSVSRAPDTGCNGGSCAPITFTLPTDAGAAPAQFPIPADIPHGPGAVIGLRASVTVSTGDGGVLGELECRVFDPARPETLSSTNPNYAIKITAGGTRWLPSGEVGLFAQRARARFGSLDVLRGP